MLTSVLTQLKSSHSLPMQSTSVVTIFNLIFGISHDLNLRVYDGGTRRAGVLYLADWLTPC